jgi:hypothetical protein
MGAFSKPHDRFDTVHSQEEPTIMRRILLWGLPFLLGSLLVVFAILPMVFANQEQSFQAMRQEGWTVYLQEYKSGGCFSSMKSGDITIDASGRIWAAGEGGCVGLNGLHVFNGAEWINHDGSYRDLDIDPQGRVWALSTEGNVDVFTWQQGAPIKSGEFQLGEQESASQLEIDSQGRIWILYRKASDQPGNQRIARIIVQEGGSKPIISLENTEILINGRMAFFEADNRGRVWMAIQNVGLSVFDGDTLQRVPDQGQDLSSVEEVAFDKQGRTWVITWGGDLLTYDGKAWSIVKGETLFGLPRGITVDRMERVWVWVNDKVYLLNGSAWTVFTPENSGLAGKQIFGLVVDNMDRVWIGASSGVSMIPFEQAQPNPKAKVNAHTLMLSLEKWVSGLKWFLPPVVVVLWLATFFNILPGTLIGLLLGLLSLVFLGPPVIESWGYLGSVINPGVIGTFVGMICGMAGSLIDKRRKAPGFPGWSLGLAIAGWAVGFWPYFLLAAYLGGG